MRKGYSTLKNTYFEPMPAMFGVLSAYTSYKVIKYDLIQKPQSIVGMLIVNSAIVMYWPIVTSVVVVLLYKEYVKKEDFCFSYDLNFSYNKKD